MSGMPLRDYRIHRYVNAFCPLCHEEGPDRPLAEVQRLSGWLVERDGRIWLERGCATHGLIRTLYDESPEILRYLEQWTAPTKVHEPDVRGNFKPVPVGLRATACPRCRPSTPASCSRTSSTTATCKCPTCFAESSPGARVGGAAGAGARIHRRPALAGERPHRRADALRRRADALPVAGRAARRAHRPSDRADPDQHQRPCASPRTTSCSTLLTRHRERVEVYLQYDGESAEASTYHRGADIRRFKERAIERLSANGHLHDAHHDRRARRQRRRDRRR